MERVIKVPCDNCGAEMTFSPGHEKLHCQHCGHTQALPKETDMVIERSFNEGIQELDRPRGLSLKAKSFHCTNCGADTVAEAEAINLVCPFCGSKKVNEEALDTRVIRPSGILPFKVTREQARDKFKKWLKKGFFKPNKLAKFARLEGMRSVYIPYWTYDAKTDSHWTAQAGYHYYVTETYTDSEGNTQTRQVQRTRWVPVNGYYERLFDDVLVVASHGIKQQRSQKLEPFDIKEVVNFDSRYVLGHAAEVYQKDLKEGFDVAEKIMDSQIRSAIAKQVPGDTHRNLRINTRKSRITYKHLLLPVWVAGYQFGNKVYQFLVNGETGKATGSKPIAWWKVFLLIGVVAAIVVTLVLVLNGNNAQA